MNIVALCGVALIAAILSVTLKKHSPETSIIISIAAGIILLMAILSKIIPAVNQIQTLISNAGMSAEYAGILFKAVGICLICQFSADSCKDAGEAALASKVEFAGKIMILILALPLFEKISQIALSLINSRLQ
ncbi:MAG: SpoIIIAC/SpoIIIAD family protein [Bacillota bacterium]|nr:SpoIIIAC/SpoIIIAD family protein [Bacillota bacterium]